MRHFLLVYDQAAGQIVRMREFADDEREVAVAERYRLEGDSLSDANIEVVILGADSIEQLRTTHGRYFKSVDQLARGDLGAPVE